MAPAQHGNGFDPERTKQCIDRIEAVLADIESIKGSAMAKCREKHDEIAEIYEEAKTAWGIPKRALKAVVKVRAAERKLKAMREGLEDDDQDSFDQIRHAIGDLADTPLGQAALDAAKKGDDDDVRPRHLKQREADRKKEQDALNAAASAH